MSRLVLFAAAFLIVGAATSAPDTASAAGTQTLRQIIEQDPFWSNRYPDKELSPVSEPIHLRFSDSPPVPTSVFISLIDPYGKSQDRRLHHI